MVIYDQLRISDDGQSLFIDAHVNKASYFDNVYIKRVTICTENQVHESDPQTYGSDNIYQKDISEINYPIQPVYPKTQVLSDDKLMQTMMDNGGWFLNFPGNDKADTYCLSVLLSGKFSALDSSCAPVMVVATEDYDPFNSDLNDEDND